MESLVVQGTKIELGGEEYIVPALNFRQLQEFKTEIAAMQNMGSSGDALAELIIVIPVVTAALKRNYPDMNEEKVTDLLDLSNYRKVFESVLGITDELRDLLTSRLAQIKLGEARPLPTRAQ
jgi:hypothetical protein